MTQGDQKWRKMEDPETGDEVSRSKMCSVTVQAGSLQTRQCFKLKTVWQEIVSDVLPFLKAASSRRKRPPKATRVLEESIDWDTFGPMNFAWSRSPLAGMDDASSSSVWRSMSPPGTCITWFPRCWRCLSPKPCLVTCETHRPRIGDLLRVVEEVAACCGNDVDVWCNFCGGFERFWMLQKCRSCELIPIWQERLE